jgi:hypothetical protein
MLSGVGGLTEGLDVLCALPPPTPAPTPPTALVPHGDNMDRVPAYNSYGQGGWTGESSEYHHKHVSS